MPATILTFEPRPSTRLPVSPEASPCDGPTAPPPAVTEFRRREEPTPRQIAHRWAMFSHLSRGFPRPPDTVR